MKQAILNRNGIRSVTGPAALLIVALFALVSCATSFDMSDERFARPGPEWGIVIGSVLVQPEMLPKDKPATGSEASKMSYEFDIVQIQQFDPDGRNPYAPRYRLQTKAGEEQTFISRLRPGQYLFKEFYEGRMVGLGGDLDVVFTVAPGEIRYIGRVRVEIPQRAFSGNAYRFAVEYAREPTLARVSKQHAELTSAAVDGPMQVRLRPAP